jgi:hypothetical protein
MAKWQIVKEFYKILGKSEGMEMTHDTLPTAQVFLMLYYKYKDVAYVWNIIPSGIRILL